MYLKNLFIISHLFFPIFMNNSLIVSAHAYAVLLLILNAFSKDKNANRLILITSYIIGSELIWRGFRAYIFYEQGKILTIIILIFILVKMNPLKFKSKLGIIYISLLLPSIFIIDEFNRQDLSHALSGPILTGFAITVFSNIYIDKKQFKQILFFCLMPILSLLIYTVGNTVLMGGLNYVSAYQYRIESGGIGPNQVSNILGLGSFLSFLYAQISKGRIRIVFILISISAIIQSMLTHSRGGFWSAIISIAVFTLFQITSTRQRIKFLSSLIPLISIMIFVIFPYIDELSGGSIANRFSDTDLTSRQEIIISEVDAFKQNPILGIGPGQGRKFRLENYMNYKHNHTEYTRLIAEHGLFGFMIILILLSITFKIIIKKKGLERSVSLSILSWCLLFMTHSSTRLAAPCLLFGLAISNFNFGEKYRKN